MPLTQLVLSLKILNSSPANTIAAIFCVVALLPIVVAAETISVVTEKWEPYNYQENDVVIGSSTRIVKQILDHAKVDIERGIQLYPWTRAYSMALNMPNTLIYTILRTPEREHLFHWIGPIVPTEKFYFYKASSRSDMKIDHLNDAKGYKVSIPRATIHETYLKKNGFNENDFVWVDNQTRVLKLLLMGRVDLMIDTEKAWKVRVEKQGVDMADLEQSIELQSEEYYMAFSLNTSSEIITRVLNSYEGLKKQGLISLSE